MQIEVLTDADGFASRVADWLLGLALEENHDFAILLSGGSTPRPIYERLVSSDYSSRFPWRHAHWFWSDERFVPHDDARSNFRMAWDAMLSHVPVPAGNIHPVRTEHITPEESAAAYERELKSFYGADTLDPTRPLFAVTLLGLGEDGHLASLFPGQEVLNERRRWAAALIGAASEPRITLTYPTLESSRHAAFLVAGPGKAAILRRFRAGDPELPARRFRPLGELCVFADKAAAGD
ncbi:MAG TPA: 6-phosphogluconolactonase [Micropepsaceae bacterium]|jgi:6-phosphogluconolactonase|nr:6-phosphogluconolactonase [Micropepsaceae bacterium]